MTVYAADVDAVLASYGVIGDWLGRAGATPPMTLVGVARLAIPGMLVETPGLRWPLNPHPSPHSPTRRPHDQHRHVRPALIDNLARAVAGTVLSPDDPRLAAEVAPFNAAHTPRPAVVVGATSASDVAAAVRGPPTAAGPSPCSPRPRPDRFAGRRPHHDPPDRHRSSTRCRAPPASGPASAGPR